MSLLENHLEQIQLSSNAIAELPFPQPRIFTNALLGPHDITALIRDTEAHERALFQTDPSAKSQRRATRRGTMFQSEADGESMASRIYAVRNNRNQSAVARVLGSDMMDEIKRSAGTSARGTRNEMSQSYGEEYGDYDNPTTATLEVTDADIEREMEEIRELERRKRALEARVSGMERDLGGLIG
ncbi:hypothetical protein ACP6JC_006758 [Aspergillus fumigatus]